MFFSLLREVPYGPLISELLDLPDQVYKGDFVLNLSDVVTQFEVVLRDYVVTPQLADCFDNALGFIRSALDAHSSKAAYLHGSFGSGKSHFMAVLHLLLQHNRAARALPELAAVCVKHAGCKIKNSCSCPITCLAPRTWSRLSWEDMLST